MNGPDLLAAVRAAVAAGDGPGAAALVCEYVELLARRPLPEHRRHAGDIVAAYLSLFTESVTHGEG